MREGSLARLKAPSPKPARTAYHRTMLPDPSTLRIRLYPDPILRQKAQPVDLTPSLHPIIDRMFELMREANGIGLAAPQVGLPWRLFIIDIPEGDERSAADMPPTATSGPTVYINPELSQPARSVEVHEEGCLSLPDIHGDVIRPTEISVTATDLKGQRFTHRAAGLYARCIQHEFDHIDGVLFLDRMIQSSRARVRAQVRDLERRAGIR